MPLYPTLQDMRVDHMMTQPQSIPSAPPAYNSSTGFEPSEQTTGDVPAKLYPSASTVVPSTGQSLGLQSANVTHYVREVTLSKDKNGKIGLKAHAVDNGIFVCLVSQDSPAAMAGLRFGDQILTINDVAIAGYTVEKVYKMLRDADANGIRLTIRDRPFERTVSMGKDSSGSIGFQFKNGRIIAVVQNSSAAQNGLLTDHQILEVNGKNVIGLRDKEITAEIKNSENPITVTIMPAYIYKHMIEE